MQQIINIWPSVAELASDLGLPYQTVASWRRRGMIPARYDFELLRAASWRGWTLTLRDIAMARAVAASRQRERRP